MAKAPGFNPGHPTVEATTRGDLANRRACPRTAVMVFLDPDDAPFLEDWIQSSQASWGAFHSFAMADTQVHEEQWERAAHRRWWKPLSAATQQVLDNGPTPEIAQSVVTLFPELNPFDRVVFACTYGKSRSQLAAQAYRCWRDPAWPEDPQLVQRNSWWWFLLQGQVHLAPKP